MRVTMRENIGGLLRTLVAAKQEKQVSGQSGTLKEAHDMT